MGSTRKPGTTQVGGSPDRVWRWVLTDLVLLSLVVMLATRFQVTVPDATTVQCSASQAMRQNMNQDAVRWTVPILQLTVLQAPTFHPPVMPKAPVLPSFSVEENLYKRPPPAC
jgi:hypothetical protein